MFLLAQACSPLPVLWERSLDVNLSGARPQRYNAAEQKLSLVNSVHVVQISETSVIIYFPHRE